jgi:hypothetical protein
MDDGSDVSQTCAFTSPTQTGGTIFAGLYNLTAVTDYSDGCVPGAYGRYTMQVIFGVDGPVMEISGVADGETVTASQAFVTSGTDTIVVTRACGDFPDGTGTYTATDTGLTLLLSVPGGQLIELDWTMQ